jgi:ARG and Rhodanese-Phosphatase-superfamily-associated Protein domain
MRAVLALLVVSAVACGDDGTPSTARARPDEREPVHSAARRPEAPIDLALAPGLELRRPLRDGNLAIVPIVATGTPSRTHYLTLADGVARREVRVRELGHGDRFEVDQVRIRNRSRQPLFVMTGELIFDGLQDRALAEDRVIPPGKSVRVAVRCVERGREDGELGFRVPGLLAELAIRRAVVHQSQTEVWGTVEALNEAHGLAPPTKTYRDLALHQQGSDLARRRDRLAHQLAALPDRAALVGLAEVIDGRVVSIERFANAELYGALEAELLGAYLASDDGAPHEGHTLLPADVRAFAAAPEARVTEASFTVVAKP